jgi:phosphoenolpyruvate carboxykinase (ATP)
MSLEDVGVGTTGTVHVNLSEAQLIEAALVNGEGLLASSGAFVSDTGERTGRSPNDRYLYSGGNSKDRIEWGDVNRPVEPDAFEGVWKKAAGHLADRDLFVIDGFVGADPGYRIRVRVVTEFAWHALFARQLFRRPDRSELSDFEPDFHVLGAPTLAMDPAQDPTDSDVFVGLDLENSRVVICGTQYAGEIKKAIFTSGNFLFPRKGALGMHCSANVGDDGEVALFFGLSGTGKTTLSADPERRLIGDDEHGWSDNGIFNFEGGCYAKCIDLSEETEPQIWNAVRFGTVCENVVVDPESREIDYSDSSKTENTRAAYPLEFIPNFVPEGRGGHAKTIVFLTADAFGVLPPIARLTLDRAAYHFLSGFTAKLAGTEAGLGDEPVATFSACFGAPFLPLDPGTYAEMLMDRMRAHETRAFLLNTGWTGGPFGEGHRIDLDHTRSMVRAALGGELDLVETFHHSIFNLEVPTSCPDVPSKVLDPQSTWSDKEAYEIKAKELARMFTDNFERFAASVPAGVAKAGPRSD